MPVDQSRTLTRERLLDAAVEAVAHSGYTAATVAQMISKARVSRSTFYQCFPDKDQCIREATKKLGDQLRAAVQLRVSAGDAQAIAPGLAETLIGFAHKEPTQARVLFTELLAGGAEARAERDTLIESLSSIVEDAWRREHGQTPTHDLPASVLVGGIFRLLSFRMRRGASGPHNLEPAVLAWIDSYTLNDAKPQWQDAAALDDLRVPTTAPVDPIPPPQPLGKGRHRLQASQIENIQRDRLLHATAECVYKEGYAAVTVADIVQAAQVSRDIFYKLFHDKQTAVTKAMQVAFERSMTAGAGAFFATSDWPEQMWASGLALSEYYASDPNFVYLTFVESYAAGSTAIDLVEQRTLAFILLLEQGYQYNEDLPHSTSEIIAFATFELAYQEIQHKRPPEQLSRLLPQLTYINLAPFKGAQEATKFIYKKTVASK
jgi:AcrR family transcriptional regulator